MDNTEKARELINKHLYLHGGDGLGITNGDVYRAVLDAVSEALTIPVVKHRRDLRLSLPDVLRFIDSDLIEIKLYGNDGYDNQEVLDGREYMKKLIKELVKSNEA